MSRQLTLNINTSMNEINVTPAATFTPATSNLDYSVETVSLLTPEGEASGWMANRRTDTKAVLGVCTERYTLVQNSSLIETVETAFADNKLGDFTRKAHVVRDGARVYVQYDFKNQLVKLPKVGDDLGLRLILNNSFDRSCRVSFEMGILRLVCTNGLKTLQEEFSLTQKHSDKLDVSRLVDVVAGAVEGFKESTKVFSRLADRPVKHEQGYAILDNLTKAKVIADRNVDKVKIIWNDPSHREDKSRNLWSLYNAVTQFTSHQVEPTSYELAQRINRGTLVALNKASLVEADFKKLTTAVANN
jgi:hypothetical protein